jgi:hypothetical protein
VSRLDPGIVTTAHGDLLTGGAAGTSAGPSDASPGGHASAGRSPAADRADTRNPTGITTTPAPPVAGSLPTPAGSAATSAGSATGGNLRSYPLHTGVQTTWFNVGGVDDPHGGQETQNVASAWDPQWSTHFGGCDGTGPVGPQCIPEQRVAANDWFPQHMTPKENPFYVAVPFDDVNDAVAAANRGAIPWVHDPGYAGLLAQPGTSVLKNRWVAVTGPAGLTCYAQVEDAGPGYYHDFGYVFTAAAPVHRPSLDVSPSVFSCIGGNLNDGVTTTTWRFVDTPPAGPWTRVVTSRR